MLRAFVWAAIFAYGVSAASAGDREEIERILRMEAPPGVVFEIVSGDREGLSWAIPAVSRYARQLREKFPALPIAVVSHGREQFALMSEKRPRYSQLHVDVRKLVKQEDIPVHVCGTYAGWNNVSEEEFPDYVDVAPAGPVQIEQYVELGYVRVRLIRPKR